jgi:hypothetical protein
LNVQNTTRDIAEAVHRETRPASFAVKFGSYVLDLASKAGAIFAGFVK